MDLDLVQIRPILVIFQDVLLIFQDVLVIFQDAGENNQDALVLQGIQLIQRLLEPTLAEARELSKF